MNNNESDLSVHFRLCDPLHGSVHRGAKGLMRRNMRLCVHGVEKSHGHMHIAVKNAVELAATHPALHSYTNEIRSLTW